MGFAQTVKGYWSWFFPQRVPAPHSSQSELGDAPSLDHLGARSFPQMRFIDDGVDYTLPVLLDEARRDALEQSGGLGDYLETYRNATASQFDSPYKGDLPFLPVTEDSLSEWSWATRKRVIAACHAAYQRNPLAKRSIGYASNFAVGNGFRLT